jgi:hypothetical protein
MLVTEKGYIKDSADFRSYRSVVSNLYFVDYESFNLSNLSLTLTKVMQTMVRLDLLIIDKLGFVPFSENGAILLFDIFAIRYEKGSIAVIMNNRFTKCLTTKRTRPCFRFR